MGRPTKLTPEVQKRIVDAIAAGNYYETAAAYGGVSYDAFNEWMTKGASGAGPYRQFRQAVEAAAAQAEVSVVAQWKKAVPESWQAGRDFLARRYPDRWGAKDRVAIGGDPDNPAPIRVDAALYPITLENAKDVLTARLAALAERQRALDADGGPDAG